MHAHYRPRNASGWALCMPAHLIGKMVRQVTGHDLTSEITEIIKWADDHNHHIVDFVATILKR